MVFLDSDLLIKCLQPKKNPINLKAQKVLSDLEKQHSNLKITAYNYAEVMRGTYLTKRPARSQQITEKFLKKFSIILPNMESFKEFSRISAHLINVGQSIGEMDELIASIVVASGDTLYTRNVKHFGRVPVLNIVNWELIEDDEKINEGEEEDGTNEVSSS